MATKKGVPDVAYLRRARATVPSRERRAGRVELSITVSWMPCADPDPGRPSGASGRATVLYAVTPPLYAVEYRAVKLLDPAEADERFGPPLVDVHQLDGPALVRRADHEPVADIDRVVLDIAVEAIEDEVARLQLVSADPR